MTNERYLQLVQDLKILQIVDDLFTMDDEAFFGNFGAWYQAFEECNPAKKFRIWLIDQNLKVYN